MLARLAVDMGRDRDALVARTLPAEDPTRGKLEQVLDNTDQAIAEGRDQLRELRMRDSAGLERVLATRCASCRKLILASWPASRDLAVPCPRGIGDWSACANARRASGAG